MFVKLFVSLKMLKFSKIAYLAGMEILLWIDNATLVDVLAHQKFACYKL